MRRFRAFWLRAASSVGRKSAESDMAAEIESNFELHIAENIQRGMDPAAARREAVLRFGNPESVKESYRDRRSLPALQMLSQDLTYAFRTFQKSPGFTLAAVVTLALGIGANTAIFSVVDAALIRPLPYPSADRLVNVWATASRRGIDHSQTSAGDYFDWHDHASSFEALASHASWPMNLTGVADPLHLSGRLVSANFFDALGVAPERGRTFLRGEDKPGNDSVVISHRLWVQLGSAGDIIGKTLVLNGGTSVVVGVMPAGFHYPIRETDVWVPLPLDAKNRAFREGHWMTVFGRLRAGASIESATREMQVIASRIEREFPATNSGWSVRLVSLREELTGNVRPVIWAFQGAAGLLLLMGCVNLANLLLARAASRSRELAIRSSLGAGRGRIVRQLLTESLLLALGGGAGGLLLAYAAVKAIRASDFGFIPNATEVSLSAAVVLFAVACSLLVGVLFGLAPALQAARTDLQSVLKAGGRGTQSGVERRRNLLVSAEVALAFVLLAGGGLLVRSLWQMTSTDPGFRSANVLSMKLMLPRSQYSSNLKQAAVFDPLLAKVRSMPGVRAAGAVSDPPLNGNDMTFKVVPENFQWSANEPHPEAVLRAATPGYLATVDLRLAAGRDFADFDTAQSTQVAMINEATAKRYWPGVDPIGRRIRIVDEDRWMTIVGVTRNLRKRVLSEEEAPVLYVPYTQKSQPWLSWASLVLRTDGDPRAYLNAIRAEIRGLDRNLPLSDIETLDEVLSKATAFHRLRAVLIGSIAGVALVMALLGVYGVLSWAVAQRTQEIGIRLALGAPAGRLTRQFLGTGLVRVVAGILVGAAAALGVTRWIETMLFGVAPRDPVTFLAVAALLIASSVVAMWLPTRRALRIDPTIAIRMD